MTNLYKIYEQHPIITIDSREVSDGSIFFAIRGDSFDGNDFAQEALDKGAAYVVVDRPEVAKGDRYIVVEDTTVTLQNLATYHRRVLGIPILAITGSNGKTTTKELVARVLSKRYRVVATKGNLNNHLGVPLTLLSMRRGTEFGVVEMGASARGEIELLCTLAQPDFGLITNIGYAHFEGFGSLEGVTLGKGELFDYLASHRGLAFYLREDETLTQMVELRHTLLAKSYSCDVANGVKNFLSGSYNRFNIAAAITIGEYFGVVHRQIQEAIESYQPNNHRSQRVETNFNTLVLDCYNANPTSMKAAIEDFASTDSWRNKAVILGDMLELGKYADEGHREILRLLDELAIKRIYLIGENFARVAEDRDVTLFPNVEALSDFLHKTPLEGHTILIKGSNSIGLDALEKLL